MLWVKLEAPQNRCNLFGGGAARRRRAARRPARSGQEQILTLSGDWVFAFAKVIHLRYKSCDMWRLFKEFLLFLRQEKKWWLIPLVVILLALGALIVFSSGSVLAPFMYPFM